MREKLEQDLIGCKAWIRGMEDTERLYRTALIELGSSQERAHARTSQVVELRDKVGGLGRGGWIRLRTWEAFVLSSQDTNAYCST